MSRSLADSYLKSDGTPITEADRTKTFVDMFTDRDPRMAETIMYPGFINEGDNSTLPTKIVLDYGGLGQIKFLPRTDATYRGRGENITDLPIIRYAEILLINAEAKAELGILTKNDLNATVNLFCCFVVLLFTPQSCGNARNDYKCSDRSGFGSSISKRKWGIEKRHT